MIEPWVDFAGPALAAGEPVALVSVLATEGSAPRGPGTRMAVTRAGIGGTIGGGALEHQAIDQARALLGLPAGQWRVQDYPLGPLLGQCCGGRVRLLVEHLDAAAAGWIGATGLLETHFAADGLSRALLDDRTPVAPLPARGPRPEAGERIVERLGQPLLPVHLFGAGHVGQAIARALSGLPIALAWFDSRPEMAAIPGVVVDEAAALAECAAGIPPGGVALILTHDHALDYDLTRAALASPACFVGLIGSATKRARFLARLARDGADATRLTCPIGIAGIAGKEPAVIAVAVAAQLLQLHQALV
ncbi:xanthine dehydrogenase accessory protein XdhC [Sphingomonas naphthae]|uniref:Xanthine dehydrogenase accessory protein XdhC n=1 Tax=Sphingomonas naphthae TaxID=1813468 RepID=A0ABY7TMD6_9SPHN|nr:xanthine dehydrogenase accessory protein XdhC [Sphingomonas naphthae]WCT74375.1 xanthine dehydrogenase accessory protein XdhC [Sphingomonas naphthae]